MIVCHCAVVTDADVVSEAAGGCTSLRSLCASTGAGRECGGCVPSLRSLLVAYGTTKDEACQDGVSHVVRPEVRHAARQPTRRPAPQ